VVIGRASHRPFGLAGRKRRGIRAAGTRCLKVRYSSPKRRSRSASSYRIITHPVGNATAVSPYSTTSPEPTVQASNINR
jgi:hypothetical protein